MAIDSWLPVGYKLPNGSKCRLTLFEGADWQIVETEESGRSLIATAQLAGRWTDSGVIDGGLLHAFQFGPRALFSIPSATTQLLCPVTQGRPPQTNSEAVSFAHALRETRKRDTESPLQDAIFLERFSRLLPTYSISSRMADDVVLGYWLTGGVPVSIRSERRIQQLSGFNAGQLAEVVAAAGLPAAADLVTDTQHPSETAAVGVVTPPCTSGPQDGPFELPGRPELESFLNEHVVDIVKNRERYKALGIGFPSAIVLHGPPGCGKTFAVERLIDFLGWPSFQIEASSVASPYIHETSKKIAGVFDAAMQSAPSVLVIDEMDAFLADRQMGSGHHRVEEVAEFLRRIPEATKNEVLVVAMTNRLDMIDAAILRRGRFDHVIKVDYASVIEVQALLEKLLRDVPREEDVDIPGLAKALAGRPLSDVAFVVREAARLAARSGRSQLDQSSLAAAMRSAPARTKTDDGRRIGFL